MLPREEFEKLVAEAVDEIPKKFQKRIKNVVILVEDEPSSEVREQENLDHNETLLGLYHGVPATARGGFYGVGPTLPDSITLYQLPIEGEARGDRNQIREIIRDTIWHEVAHYFGFNEHSVGERENKGTNKYE